MYKKNENGKWGWDGEQWGLRIGWYWWSGDGRLAKSWKVPVSGFYLLKSACDEAHRVLVVRQASGDGVQSPRKIFRRIWIMAPRTSESISEKQFLRHFPRCSILFKWWIFCENWTFLRISSRSYHDQLPGDRLHFTDKQLMTGSFVNCIILSLSSRVLNNPTKYRHGGGIPPAPWFLKNSKNGCGGTPHLQILFWMSSKCVQNDCKCAFCQNFHLWWIFW